MRERLAGARARLRGAAQIELQVSQILEHHHVGCYLKVRHTVCQAHTYKQTQCGRPGKDTAYRKIARRRYDIDWQIDEVAIAYDQKSDEVAIAYDQKSDGTYPLISNDRSLSPAQLLAAHKGQPKIEERFEQVKTVHEIAPVFLKNEGRIEALFTQYLLTLLVQALIARAARGDEARSHRRTADLP